MKQRLLFLGPPGAGKGTQASRICASYGLRHLSTGDLLRSEVVAETELGKQAADLMNQGELVSDEIVLAIVESQLSKPNNGWLLDGFPRNVKQAESLGVLLRNLNQEIEAVVLLEVDDELLLERLLLRGRDDDKESVIINRLKVYREKTAPLIEYYKQQGLVLSVEANNSIEAITAQINQLLS